MIAKLKFTCVLLLFLAVNPVLAAVGNAQLVNAAAEGRSRDLNEFLRRARLDRLAASERFLGQQFAWLRLESQKVRSLSDELIATRAR